MYNACSISTLPNESFFSDLARLDKEGHRYPKACNVAKVMGRVVPFNYFKHNPNKNYAITMTMKGTFPVQLAEFHKTELQEDTEENHTGFYCNHFLDYPDQDTLQWCRHEDITTGLWPLWCVKGVRQFC